jgi:predicted nucleic-acid-binding protein
LFVAALDTNVLIRFLVQTDLAQSAAVKALIEELLHQGDVLFVPVSVSLELEWVLRASFEFDKQAVLHALSSLLSAAELHFESEAALEDALEQYGQTSADYADCLHAALAAKAGCGPMWTFDKRAIKLDGAQLLTQR